MRKIPSLLAVSFVIASLGGCATQTAPGSFMQFIPSVPSIPQFVMNGLSIKPVSNFPAQAFAGLPPIRSLADFSALATGAKQFAQAGHAAVTEGNMETALLNWYIAQHLAARSMSISQASIQSIKNIDKNGDATIPPRSLVLLPVANMSNPNVLASVIYQNDFAANEPFDWAAAPKLAGTSANVLGQALNGLNATGSSDPYARQYASNAQQKLMARDELPLDTPVRLNNGFYVERKSDVFVIYNDSDSPSVLPLSKVGYVPPLASQSIERINAVPLIRSISGAIFDYLAYQEGRYTNSFDCNPSIPNKYTCTNGVESLFFDDKGRLVRDAQPGKLAYKNNGIFKVAMDSITAAHNFPAVKQWREACLSGGLTGQDGRRFHNNKIVGSGADLLKLSCKRLDNNSVKTMDFIIGEKGLVKTYSTLMAEKDTRDRMTNAVKRSQALSDLVAMVPVVGSVEDVANCLNLDSSFVKNLSGPSNAEKTLARLAGWKPEPVTANSVMGTAVSCLGAVPLVSHAATATKGASKLLGNTRLGSFIGENADKVGRLFKLFDDTLLPGGFAKSAAEIERLFPNNTQLAQLVKRVNDAVLRGNGMSSTMSGLTSIRGL